MIEFERRIAIATTNRLKAELRTAAGRTPALNKCEWRRNRPCGCRCFYFERRRSGILGLVSGSICLASLSPPRRPRPRRGPDHRTEARRHQGGACYERLCSVAKKGEHYAVDQLVKHPQRPEWGPGRVVAISEGRLHVFFRDDLGAKAKVFLTELVSLRVCDEQADAVLDELPDAKFDGQDWVLPKVKKPARVRKGRD